MTDERERLVKDATANAECYAKAQTEAEVERRRQISEESDRRDVEQALKELEDRLGKLEADATTTPDRSRPQSNAGLDGGFINEEFLESDIPVWTFTVSANDDNPDGKVDVSQGTWWHPDGDLSGSATGIGDPATPYIVVSRAGGVLTITAAAAESNTTTEFTLCKLVYDGVSLDYILYYHFGDFWSL